MWTRNRIVVGAVALAVLVGAASAQRTVTPQVGGGIGSFDGGISALGGVPFNPSCAQGATYIAALTAPSGAEQTAYKNAICGMVADGTFQLLDALYIHANTSAANAKVNAVAPGTHNLVQTGSLTFTADQGFTGDGATGFLDTGITPSTNGGHMTLNSASFGFCVLNNRTVAAPTTGFGAFDSGNGVGSYFLTFFTGPTNGGALNDTGGDQLTSGIASSQGAWTFTRTASNVAAIYSNGLPLPTSQSSGSVSLTDRSIYVMARNDVSGPTGWVTDQQAYFFMGSGLTAGQAAAIYSRLGVMMFALGNTTCATPSSATNYFFDSVAGSDAANCQTSGTPCQTVARMNALPHYGGGTINWKGASSFTGCLVLAASRNVTNPAAGPITIAQYSTGAAPIITSNCGGANVGSSGPKTAAITLDSINAIVNGIVVRGSGLTAGSATQYGIAVQNSAGTLTSNYTIENTDISGFGVVGLGTGDAGSDIFSGGFSEAAGFPTACGFMTVSVLNNTLHGSSSTSGENNGGFGTGCNGGQIQQYTGNLIFNISGIASNSNTGNGAFLAQGETGFAGLGQSFIKFTLAHDIGANGTTCGGPVGLWAYQTYLALLEFDEVYNVKGSGGLPVNACDFSCYDDDIQAGFGLNQYLYGHDCGGPGFVVFSGDNGDVVRYSIFENTSSYNEDGGGAFSVGAGGTSGSGWQGYNNSIFQNYSPGTSTPPTCLSLGFGGAYTGGLWANNACFNQVVDTFNRTNMLTGNSASGFNSLTMVNNDYFTTAGGILTFAVNWPGGTTYVTLALLQAGTTNEVNSKFIATGFTSPPTGTCTWTPSTQSPTWPPIGCPSAYSTLAAGLKSAGVNLLSSYAGTWFTAPYPTTEGVRDYYANAIDPSTSGCRNMGAYGVCP